jgi:signal transduction histidine kinase
MNFVTAVSHELKTPLTVIISGAENICNGVVETKQHMLQYGAVIGKQARQLYELVEQILLFAATRDGRQHYSMTSIDIREAIELAVASTASLIQENHFIIDCQIDSGLPKIRGNSIAVSQCLQNLITNAVKYGSEKGWLGIRATAPAEHGEVRISVSDHGMGIAPEDLPHIFEPFYRSPAVRDAQIHGTGLGLPLSQSIAQAMGGRLDVVSTPGRGSTFTLYLERAGHPDPEGFSPA